MIGFVYPNWKRIRGDARRVVVRSRWRTERLAREAFAFVSVNNLLHKLTYGNYDWDFDELPMSPAARVLLRVQRGIETLSVVLRLLFTRRADDCQMFPLWMTVLYRAKAIVCLLLGLRYTRDYYSMVGFTLIDWNWRQVSYECDEWDCDTVEVTYGIWSWRVLVNQSSFP